MDIDNTISEIILEIAKEKNLPKEKVNEIIQALYKTVRYIIEDEKPGSIKLDYFGKFSFNSAYKRKLQDIKEKNEAISNK